MAGPIIAAEGLTKDHRLGPHTVHALRGGHGDDRARRVRRGDGPSGSGKSTFMNLLGCLDTPTAGRYVLDSEDVTGYAGRVLSFRDGRLRKDEPVAAPLDAERALAEQPVEEEAA